MSSFKRIDFLDYLRAISIIFIALYHYVLEVSLFHIRPSIELSMAENMKRLEIFRNGADGAWIGNLLVFLGAQGYQFVGIFIFLSGFGLTYSKMVKGSRGGAWFKRIIRLLPQFQIAIIFAFVINYISLHYLRRYLVAAPTGELYPYLRLLLYPFVWTDFYGIISRVNPSLWFSGLILQYYIFYDALYWLLHKIRPWVFLVIMFVVTVGYRYWALFEHDGDPLLFSLLPVRLFEFGLGMAAAYVYVHWNYDLFYRLKWWCLGIGAVVWYFGFYLGFTEYGRVFNDLLTTIGLMVMGIMVFRNVKNVWIAGVLGAIGAQSYWLYLLHNQPITQLLTPWTFKQWDAQGMSGYVLLLGLSAILFIFGFFSLSMNRFKRK